MGAAEVGLDTVATVAQLAGTAASHLSMANVGGIIKMIVKLAQTARRNKKECVQLADRVGMIMDLQPHLLRGLEEKATRAPLERLVATLREALELVKSCQNSTMVGRVLATNLQATKLADVQSRIDFYLRVFPLISHMAMIAAIDRIPNGNAASEGPTRVPPRLPASQPAEAAKGDIAWAEVAAASTVTVVSNDKATGTVVYKARLRDGRHVAIKSFDGDEAAFRAELAVVSGLRHQHIVRLLCWWEGDGNRLLVYEYVGDGTLRDYLRRGGECASWRARMEVLLAAARAIEHVHCHAVVHGNVGSSNILLDEISRKPCVSGFGASVVDAVGSRTGRLESAAGDVRGFGVVMLEVLTGREPVVSIWKEEKKGEVEVTLESFALPSIEAGKLGDVLDRRPATNPTPRQLTALKLVADMAARCVSPSSSPPGKGPTMSDVVAKLNEVHELICDDTHKLA